MCYITRLKEKKLEKGKIRMLYYIFMGIFVIGISIIISLSVPIFIYYNYFIHELFSWRWGVFFIIIAAITIISCIVYHILYNLYYKS